jgi:hypothetical protein
VQLAAADPAARPALREWEIVLDRAARDSSGFEELLSLLTGLGAREQRLLQSSPFAGFLPEEERAAIFEQFEGV